MTTMLRYQQRAGRFGRELRGDDAPAADTKTPMAHDGASERIDTAGYAIDPAVVAAAIVDRLVVGRALPGSAARD